MIDERRWWERYPSRFVAEEESLRAAGINWTRNDDAFNAGVMQLLLHDVVVGDEVLELVVTYPDLYPYFRFDVDAPGLNLKYHQNPFAKNLCLIGRGTDNWHAGDTVGHLIEKQMPRVIAAGRAETRDEARDIEQHQAEPVTDYYSYAPNSMVLVDTSIKLPSESTFGTFKVATRDRMPQFPASVLRATLVSVFDESGRKVGVAPPELTSLFAGSVLEGPWRRLSEPPPEDLNECIDGIRAIDSRFRDLQLRHVDGVDIAICAVVVAEEHSWRSASEDGWIFICLVKPNARKK